jgi:hypothetical protein
MTTTTKRPTHREMVHQIKAMIAPLGGWHDYQQVVIDCAHKWDMDPGAIEADEDAIMDALRDAEDALGFDGSAG